MEQGEPYNDVLCRVEEGEGYTIYVVSIVSYELGEGLCHTLYLEFFFMAWRRERGVDTTLNIVLYRE